MVAQRVTPSTGPPRETICFKCGLKGHYKAKCSGTRIKPVLEPGMSNDSLVIGTLLDLLRNTWVNSQHSNAAQTGRLREARISPKWTDIVKSAPASTNASATPRAETRLHGDGDKPACADCAKLHLRVEELEVVVRQLKMEISRSRAANAKSAMNPAAAPWVPQPLEQPAQVVEQKSVVAEPARSDMHAGSALETGKSPVKSTVESQFSPVVSPRSKRALKRERQNKAAAASMVEAKAEPAAARATDPSASVEKKAAHSGEEKAAKSAKSVRTESKAIDLLYEQHRQWCSEHDLLLRKVQEKPWSPSTQARLEKWGAISDNRLWNCVACPGGVDNPICPQHWWEQWKK